MAFAEMRLAELRDVAQKFAVDYDPGANKKDILLALQEDGVEFALWEKLYAEKPEGELVKPDSSTQIAPDDKARVLGAAARFSGQTVLKMERKNPTYEVNGKFFTHQHPFIAMTEQEAQDIIDLVDGFRLATPREVEEYYS